MHHLPLGCGALGVDHDALDEDRDHHELDALPPITRPAPLARTSWWALLKPARWQISWSAALTIPKDGYLWPARNCNDIKIALWNYRRAILLRGAFPLPVP